MPQGSKLILSVFIFYGNAFISYEILNAMQAKSFTKNLGAVEKSRFVNRAGLYLNAFLKNIVSSIAD
jgi:hypothetical protein